jgi:hypothetical protein
MFLELVVVTHETQQLAAHAALITLQQRKAVGCGVVAEAPGQHVGRLELLPLHRLDLRQLLVEDFALRLGQALQPPG